MAQALRSVAGDGPVIVMDRPGRRRRRAEKYPEPDWGPPVEIDQIVDAGILFSREATWATIKADRFRDRLVMLTASEGVPPDESARPIIYLRNLVEAMTLVMLERPEWAGIVFPAPPVAEDEEEEWRIRSEDDAAACGLNFVFKEKRVRQEPTLPGCQGAMTDGSVCHLLRRFGEKFCPAHRKLELQELRKSRRAE